MLTGYISSNCSFHRGHCRSALERTIEVVTQQEHGIGLYFHFRDIALNSFGYGRPVTSSPWQRHPVPDHDQVMVVICRLLCLDKANPASAQQRGGAERKRGFKKTTACQGC